MALSGSLFNSPGEPSNYVSPSPNGDSLVGSSDSLMEFNHRTQIANWYLRGCMPGPRVPCCSQANDGESIGKGGSLMHFKQRRQWEHYVLGEKEKRNSIIWFPVSYLWFFLSQYFLFWNLAGWGKWWFFNILTIVTSKVSFATRWMGRESVLSIQAEQQTAQSAAQFGVFMNDNAWCIVAY